MPVLFGNGVIYAELTYAVYLVFAIPLAGLLLPVLRRPIAAGIGGSVAAMTVTCLLEEYLPFNYSAHANDFIIEQFTPFLVPNCEFKSPAFCWPAGAWSTASTCCSGSGLVCSRPGVTPSAVSVFIRGSRWPAAGGRRLDRV